MKTIYLASASLALLFASVSCSENYDIYPEEYSKVMMFKDSGAHDFTIYSPHSVSTFPISVMKGGWDPQSSSEARVRVMTEEEFNDWLLESGAGYSYLPNNCYSLSSEGQSLEMLLDFNGGEGYKVLSLNVFPPAVGSFMESYTDASRKPVIPLVLESKDGLIDIDNSEMFIIPDYKEPTVSFLNGGVCMLEDGETSYTLKVGLPFESEWDLTAKIEVDPTVLEDYNSNEGTSLGLMSADAYAGVGDVAINQGDEYATVTVNVDLDKAGFRNAIPLRITTLSLDGFEIGESTALIGIDNASKYKIDITADMLYANDCYSGDGKGVPGLCDGDFSTHFHSWYGSNARNFDKFGSYVEFTLPKEIQEIGFDHANRQSYNNGHVKRVQLYAWDGEDWVLFADCDAYGKILLDRMDVGQFGSFHCPFKFNKFRYSVIEADGGSLVGKTTAFWSCGEIVVYGK